MTVISPAGVQSGTLHASMGVLRRMCPDGGRVCDAGCLEGAYASRFAAAGYDVTGIDARQASLDKCTTAGAMNLICDDVRNIEAHGPFDAVFACGILYHLDQPVSWLRAVARCAPLIILDTHIAAQPETQNEGYAGSWYTEPGGREDPWGAWGNERSFWLTERSLITAMADAGFGLVLKHPGDWHHADRLMLIGVR